MNDYSELTAARRRERILQLLQEKEEVSVKALSKDFCVSEMTIRRDLHLLEAQGLAVVHYGGASLCNYRPMFQDFSNRQEKLYKNKLAIARTAATKIERHDTLFLDASTTILLMLRFLPGYRLTVITNSLPVVEQLYRNTNVSLHIAPGCYQTQYGGPLDYSTADYVGKFHYDKAFFGTSAIDAAFGVSATREMEGAVKSRVYACADNCYLLTDHTKFGKKNPIKYNDVRDFRCIYADSELDVRQRELIARHDGRLIICQ